MFWRLGRWFRSLGFQGFRLLGDGYGSELSDLGFKVLGSWLSCGMGFGFEVLACSTQQSKRIADV